MYLIQLHNSIQLHDFECEVISTISMVRFGITEVYELWTLFSIGEQWSTCESKVINNTSLYSTCIVMKSFVFTIYFNVMSSLSLPMIRPSVSLHSTFTLLLLAIEAKQPNVPTMTKQHDIPCTQMFTFVLILRENKIFVYQGEILSG